MACAEWTKSPVITTCSVPLLVPAPAPIAAAPAPNAAATKTVAALAISRTFIVSPSFASTHRLIPWQLVTLSGRRGARKGTRPEFLVGDLLGTGNAFDG